jgi:predicted Zn-dependent protease
MAILTKDEAAVIMKKVIAFSRAEGIEVNLYGDDTGNIRFARNTVSTSGATSNVEMWVTSNYGKKVGAASINEFDDASLEKVVRRSEELAHVAPPNPEFMEFLTPQTYSESIGWSPDTARITAAERVDAAADSIAPARVKGLTAAGYLQDNRTFQAMMNHKGLFAYHRGTSVDFTVTMRTKDGTGSGWAARNFTDVGKLDTKEASAIAIDKAMMSRNAKALEPGRYTVILEPSAGLLLIDPLIYNMDARRADEGRSFISKKGGGTKLGEKIVDERVHIYTDPLDERVPASTWTDDGVARTKLDLIREGEVANLLYDRYWASQKETNPVPFPGNYIMEGGSASLDDMIKDTKKGVLVTRFWYIRRVDPQTLLYTGLTRDGTFYIENGKIKHPIKNFRFNESPVIMLNNLETLGKQVRVSAFGTNALIPYMRIRDFTFTSLSDAV